MKNYVKEYKDHEVPEGATHYNSANMLWPECFINENSGGVYKLDGSKIWVLSQRGVPTTAIELPEEPMPSKAEWIPVVGEECDIAKLCDAPRWNKGVVDFYGKEKCIVTFYDGREAAFMRKTIVFRPLKTAEEKQREAFHLKARGVYKCRMSCEEFATALYEAGFKAPKEEV